MKGWFLLLPLNARWVMGSCASIAALLLCYWASAVIGIMWDSYGQASSTEKRTARLLGYEAAGQTLDDALEQTSQQLGRFAFAASEGDKAGALLQQALRGFAEESGLTVTGSQLVAEVENDDDEAMAGLRQLVVDLSLQGPPMALDAFLGELSMHQPKLVAGSMDIQKPRRPRMKAGDANRTSEQLNIRLEVFALQEVE